MPSKNYGGNVLITFPVPRTAATVTPELGTSVSGLPMVTERGGGGGGGGQTKDQAQSTGAGQLAEYKAKERQVRRFEAQPCNCCSLTAVPYALAVSGSLAHPQIPWWH